MTKTGRNVFMNAEEIHDSQIAPLMNQIIAICEEHGIPMVANFQLSTGEDPLYCATVVLGKDVSDYMNKLQVQICRGVGA